MIDGFLVSDDGINLVWSGILKQQSGTGWAMVNVFSDIVQMGMDFNVGIVTYSGGSLTFTNAAIIAGETTVQPF